MRSRLLALALAPPVTPTPAPGGGTGGNGGGGGIDPGGIISQLPEGTGPVATVIVVFLLFLASLVPVAAKFIPDRPPKKADQNGGAANSGVGGSNGPPALTRAEADQLQASYARLDTDLKEAKQSLREATAAVEDIRAKYDAEKEHSHNLEMELAGANQKLEVAEERLQRMEAQLAVVLRPWNEQQAQRAQQQRAQWQTQPSLTGPRPLGAAAPTRKPRRPPRHAADPGPAPDEAPTDPIREARR